MGRHRKCNNPLNQICHDCGKEKSLDEFYKNKARSNGRSSRCKECSLKMSRIPKHFKNICETCGNATYRKKFCSRECYRKRLFINVADGTILKRCPRCGESKPLTEYYHCRIERNSNGYASRCKSCASKSYNQWRKSERGKILRVQERKRNVESYKYRHKRYRPIQTARDKIRSKTDPSFALKNRVRILMYSSLRRVKNGRKWQDLVGYSIEKLRHHIEKQFKEGMSWSKFLAGEIHIDHKIPISAFNCSSPEDIDFKRCWALKNLQPMWAKDNISKHARIEKPFQPSLGLGVSS